MVASIVDDDGRACVGELGRYFSADPPRAACDEDGFVCEIVCEIHADIVPAII